MDDERESYVKVPAVVVAEGQPSSPPSLSHNVFAPSTLDADDKMEGRDPDLTTLDDSQERLLSILAVISGTLSIFGSGLILFRVFRNYRNKSTTPYDRIMGGLSVFDMISSFSFGYGTFLLPQETSPRAWAMGTSLTCNLLGFLTQLSFCAVW